MFGFGAGLRAPARAQWWPAAAGLLALLAMPPDRLGASASTSDGLGVVVLEVVDGGPAAAAGIRPGDRLRGWRRPVADSSDGDSPGVGAAPASGSFVDPLHLELILQAQRARGRVVLIGQRHGEPFEAELLPGTLVMTVRPVLPADLLAHVERAHAAAERSDFAAAAAAWDRFAAQTSASGNHRVVAWMRLVQARALRTARRWTDAAEGYEQAVDAALQTGDAGLIAHIETEQADFLLWHLRQPAEAKEILGRAQSRLHAAPQTPDPATQAHLLLGEAQVHRYGQDFSTARGVAARALDIIESIADDSFLAARAHDILGYLDWRLGDLAAAEANLSRANRLAQQAAPRERGLLGSAMLSFLARERGDLETAISHLRHDIHVLERYWPPVEVAGLQSLLASVLRTRGELDEARLLGERVLAVRRETMPGGQAVAASLGFLGALALDQGELVDAELFLNEAIGMFESLTPEGASVADLRHVLARLARLRDQTAEAETLLRSAIALRSLKTPAAMPVAAMHHDLATLLRDQGRTVEAIEAYRAAIELLELQRGKLAGADEAKVGFVAQWGHLYRDLMDLLIRRGDGAGAFALLEQSRARQLLELLRRDSKTTIEEALPQELRAEQAALESAHDDVLRSVARLALDSGPGNRGALEDGTTAPSGTSIAAQREILEVRLADIARQRQHLRNRIHAAAPHVAAVAAPNTLDVDGARAALEPGTLLLAYVVGAPSSWLFAIGPGPDDFRTIPLGDATDDLERDVATLRAAWARQAPIRRSVRARLVEDLSNRLLAPVAQEIESADRLVIIPDGVLHFLPFAALLDPGFVASRGARKARDTDTPRRLVERLPISYAASATVLAMLGRRLERGRGHAPKRSVVAFADPEYAPRDSFAPSGRAPMGSAVALPGGAGRFQGLRRGFTPTPLPASRYEAESLRSLFGDRATIWLGRDATETRAKAIGPDAAIVHFACHAVVDDSFPLESGLVLSLADPGVTNEPADNGLLQAWEIFDQVRLDADLVTLSACETSLGRFMTGEGILGLTRAFHFAGARSVLATQWRIDDRSTVGLMGAFYASLRRGASRTEALRQAQIRLLRGGPITIGPEDEEIVDASDPFHWAAFGLFGDPG